MDSDIPHHMTRGDCQTRVGLATHAFLIIYIGLRQACLVEKVEINYQQGLLIIANLQWKRVINLSTYVLLAPIYNNTRTTCHHVGKIQRGSGSIINKCLIRGIHQMIMRQ